MNAIDVSQVTKHFGEFQAVKGLSFEVPDGSIYGLLGPNGAGKSTTIRMILNIFQPDTGSILLFGQPVTPELQQRIGYLPEERGLYTNRKVGEQLVFFGRLKGLSKGEALKRVDQWLARLELSAWKDRKASELSKGMRQKVQFIVAVLHDPQVLILDEPFSGLDPVSANVLTELTLDLKKSGKTIIFSSHQMGQVEQLCDYVCLIDHGTKILGGTLRDVKRGFTHNIALVEFGGSDSFLSMDLVKNINRHANHVEILLDHPSDAQEVLRQAVTTGTVVNRFHMVEPSLNDIFIEMIGKNGKANGNHRV